MCLLLTEYFVIHVFRYLRTIESRTDQAGMHEIGVFGGGGGGRGGRYILLLLHHCIYEYLENYPYYMLSISK